MDRNQGYSLAQQLKDLEGKHGRHDGRAAGVPQREQMTAMFIGSHALAARSAGPGRGRPPAEPRITGFSLNLAFSGEPSERSERPEQQRGRRVRCNPMLAGRLFTGIP